ncbi:MAG: glycosyltransferase family 39 protein [Candidatus Diapherotrites archaeon]
MHLKKLTVFEISAIVFIAALGLALRLLFFERTDMLWDEAWHVAIGYKIATAFWTQPILPIACLAGLAVIVYILLVKRSLAGAGVISFLMLISAFVLKIPFALHTRHPPLFNIAAAFGIFLTGLPPEIIGKLISTAALMALPFFGLLLGMQIKGKKFGIVLFALLMLSPLSIFYSGTAFLNPLAVMLAYGGLAVFFAALKNSRLMPLAGVLFALAVATRYTAALMVIAFAYLLFVNRHWVMKSENRNNCAIFALLAITAIGVFLPAMLSSFGGYAEWSGDDSNYIHDIAHYSTFLADAFGGEPLKTGAAFYPELFMFFLSPLAAVFFIAGAFFALRNRQKGVLIFLLIFLAYIAFFSIASDYMAPRYALIMEFPLMVVAAYGIIEGASWLKEKTGAAYWRGIWHGAFAALIVFFVWQNAVLINEHEFHGLSEALAELPEDAVIYTSYLDSVKYYSGAYKTDTEITNSFFSKFAVSSATAGGKGEILYINTPLEDVAGRVDYVIANRLFFGDENARALDRFTLCREIKSAGTTIFWLYAREHCPAVRGIGA